MTSGSGEPGGGGSGRIDTPQKFQETFGVSRETVGRLQTYEAVLRAWQKAVNLVSPTTLDEIWHRHFADSAQLLDFGLFPPSSHPSLAGGESSTRGAEPGGADSGMSSARRMEDAPSARLGGEQGGKSWLDLGSGGGFPGLVLAILLAERQPHARMTLVESDSRKAAFLGEVARKTGVAVEIRTERSEKYATQANSQIRDVITARALAPLPKLLGLVLPFFSPQTVAVFPKGREAAVEIGEARELYGFDHTLAPSLTDAQARIVIVRNLAVKAEG